MIITATLITVATTDNRMINRENDCCFPGPEGGLKATRLAINPATFNRKSLSSSKIRGFRRITPFFTPFLQYAYISRKS